MKIEFETIKNKKVAIVSSIELIKNGQEALDLISTIRYEYNGEYLIIKKEALVEDFFDLKTGIAGEIMQKHINYMMPLAIIGDFSSYDSNSLKSLMLESNKSKNILFVNSIEEAVEIWNK